MQILSAIPETHNGPTCTTITAIDNAGKRVVYSYSHTYELLRDCNNPVSWAQWNGGTLTEAIQWIISL